MARKRKRNVIRSLLWLLAQLLNKVARWQGKLIFVLDTVNCWNDCVCSLSSLRDMETLGLFMHDLNMYDCSRQMVMAGWQHASRLECSIEKVCPAFRFVFWIYQ